MLTSKSRYQSSALFSPREDGTEVFPGLRARAIGPANGMVEHEVKLGDRLDHLARHYYNDDRLWWRIVDANPQYLFAGYMLQQDMAGSVILIPKAKE